MPDVGGRRHWPRFTLGQLLVFTLGFAVGLGVLALWTYQRPAPIVALQIRVYEMPLAMAQQLKLAPGDGDLAFCSTTPVDPKLLTQLAALSEQKAIRCLADPKLITLSGRSATFSVGGEFPYPVAAPNGALSIEFRKYGTEFNIEPVVIGQQHIRLNILATFSEIDPSRSVTLSGTVVPGVTSRTIDAGLEADSGHSALMGMAVNCFSHNNPGDITIMVITPTIEERP